MPIGSKKYPKKRPILGPFASDKFEMFVDIAKPYKPKDVSILKITPFYGNEKGQTFQKEVIWE
jgi:hypothetical protein